MRKLLRKIIVLGLAASLCLGSASISNAKTSKASKNKAASSEKSDTSHITEGDGVYIENVNSLYGKSIIKDNIIIDTYAKCKKVLKKLEKKFEKEHPRYMVENDSLYRILSAYDKTYFKKKSLCLYVYDVPDTGKTVDMPKFTIENVDGKKSAVLSVTRRNHLGGIDVPMVSYFFINVKKNKLKDVAGCISRETEYVAKLSEDEFQHAWSEGSLFTKMDDHIISPLYTTYKFLHSDPEWFKDDIVLINSYAQYKKKILSKKNISDELKNYDKNFFKKYNLFISMYCAPDSGREPRAVMLTKEKKDGNTSLVITWVRYPYYGGFHYVENYYYVAEVSKKDVKDVDSYEIRELDLFDKLY